MNKAVTLITAWGAFDEQHPEASLEEFCRHYLAHREGKANAAPAGRFMPVSSEGILMRTIGRIFKLHTIYTASALEGTGISNIDEYSLLNTVAQLQEPRKTEVIYAALQELSTGTDKLNRLKKLGYLAEYDDKEDKRSKRLKVTAKGEKVLVTCRKRITLLATMMFHDMQEDDMKLCTQLLKGVESKFAAIWLSHKGKDFEEIYREVIGTS
ncbi:DNA-binding MarR family transcriptional regulator [Chitinophaga polysaccharea]|uniref:DNA-binding MarR family transcriptional regulator n=1 Tax=Chitinophaga polysaccharea TaxID=1293035 RepID=A0A561P6U6_9BACT|nr:winged helix DNA-binding protein [Chitinophaga polysaccharea]TWF33840.1 DNA-binding MarR family transcriptional regulator [Chitinophaga polysaccharea]